MWLEFVQNIQDNWQQCMGDRGPLTGPEHCMDIDTYSAEQKDRLAFIFYRFLLTGEGKLSTNPNPENPSLSYSLKNNVSCIPSQDIPLLSFRCTFFDGNRRYDYYDYNTSFFEHLHLNDMLLTTDNDFSLIRLDWSRLKPVGPLRHSLNPIAHNTGSMLLTLAAVRIGWLVYEVIRDRIYSPKKNPSRMKSRQPLSSYQSQNQNLQAISSHKQELRQKHPDMKDTFAEIDALIAKSAINASPPPPLPQEELGNMLLDKTYNQIYQSFAFVLAGGFLIYCTHIFALTCFKNFAGSSQVCFEEFSLKRFW